MAVGVTLGQMLDDFRVEARLSTVPAQQSGAHDAHVRLLVRTQRRLWEDHDWKHLEAKRQINLVAGQRYYEPPIDVEFDRIQKVQARYNGDWCDMEFGIKAEHLASTDSDLGERSSPAVAWDVYEDGQFEIWPVPDANADETTLEGTIRVTGTKSLAPFVAEEDVCSLDADMIVMFAAAEHLLARGAKDAQAKLQQAAAIERRLIGHGVKNKTFRLFQGGGSAPVRTRPRTPPSSNWRGV